MTSTFKYVIAACLLGSGMLAGCSIVPRTTPPTVYQLSPLTPAASSSTAALDYSLTVEMPHGGRQIDSTRILVQPAQNRLEAYKNARWSDAVPAMLRARFTQALRQANAFRTVSNDNYSHHSDLTLGSEIMAFHIQYRPDGTKAVVVLDAYLGDPASQTLLATKRFTSEHALNDTSVGGAVQALSAAADAVTSDLVQWARAQASGYRVSRQDR